MIRVTVEDLATGESETKDLEDDVLVIVEGSAYVHGVQSFPSAGTQVWTVKGLRRKP